MNDPTSEQQPCAARPDDMPKPVGDAVPAPVEPGLDQPLPPKHHERPAQDDDGSTPAPPIDPSKPIGDAIPTPVEPGLDQPLPPKDPDAD